MWAKPAERLVRLLVTRESANNQDGLVAASERVLEKFAIHLSIMIGREGFRVLLKRAITLTARDYPSFKHIEVAHDGALIGLNVSDTALAEGAESLLIHFFELLITFVGDEITLRMVGVVWPRWILV